ncbi:MAG: 50S ribosomal protein L21 [Deltaproteobacteria bacterium]|jgi:large subunit ribosomal protein L21|nr:50S ribosomal protein L21 [Deltaproteobacteria bacterium]
MFAIIRADGRQYRVAQGDIIRFNRMSAEPGDAFESNQVLALAEEDNKLKIGSPIIDGAKVEGTVLQHGRDKKIVVFKRKRRKTYRRKYGHRQDHTLVKIEKISAKAPAAKKAAQKKSSSESSVAEKTATKKTAVKKTTAGNAVVKNTEEDKPTS